MENDWIQSVNNEACAFKYGRDSEPLAFYM